MIKASTFPNVEIGSIISAGPPMQVIFWQTNSIVMSKCTTQLLGIFLLISSAASVTNVKIWNCHLSRGVQACFKAITLLMLTWWCQEIFPPNFFQQDLRESFVRCASQHSLLCQIFWYLEEKLKGWGSVKCKEYKTFLSLFLFSSCSSKPQFENLR